MAGITSYSGGRRRITFKDAHGDRKSLRLGKVDMKTAETVKGHIETLVGCQLASSGIPASTATWLATISPILREKLAGVGLIDADKRREEAEKKKAEEAAAANALGPFLDDYLAKRQALVASGQLNKDTLRIDRVTAENLCMKFGRDKPLSSFTTGDGDDFRTFLLTVAGAPLKRSGPKVVRTKRTALAQATTRKRCAVASRFFADAIERDLMTKNPMAKVKKSNIATKRKAFISEADALKVLKELPSLEWQAMFALSRWGGLRVPSEVVILKWADINWEGKRILIQSPKTSRYEGRETREIPLFPELASALGELKAAAAKGEKLVLPMTRSANRGNSLRDPLKSAIKRAGLTVWPRLWHSLRATRQTELQDRFPSHVVCA
jgi:integrase